MKNTLMFILLVFCSISNAQEKLNKLQAPTSPAASILGMQPSAVLSPKSYQALETALYSSFVGENGTAVIPNDFALEFTPYWTKNHSLSLDEYLYPKKLTDQFIRNSSLSIASTQNFQLGDSTATNGLGFGYRTTFYIGNKKDREKIEKYISDLKSNTSYHGFFYEFNSQYIALANCFDAYSTFQARKILNIHDFIVFHTSRGKGFGKKLMAEIIKYAKQEDYCRITLEVRTDNEKAQSLYRNSGFSPCNPEMLFWQNIL